MTVRATYSRIIHIGRLGHYAKTRIATPETKNDAQPEPNVEAALEVVPPGEEGAGLSEDDVIGDGDGGALPPAPKPPDGAARPVEIVR